MLGGNIPHIVYVPYTTLNALSSDITTDKAILIPTEAYNTDTLDALLKRLEEVSGMEYRYENLDHYLSSFQRITSILTLLISGVAVISVIVGGIGVMNTMIASIDARTREIGIYRALGARRRDIIQIFLVESVFLCLLGGLLGICLNWSFLFIVNTIAGIRLKLQIDGVLLSIAISSICGICFGWMPACRAANLDPIQAIRGDGA